MDKKPIIIAIAILCVAIVGIWGFRGYVHDMPQVSKSETETLLTEYKENINILYDELNNKYDNLIGEDNQAEWENFSKEWVPKLVAVRPKKLDKRLPDEYRDKKNLLLSAQSELLTLWQEYNKDFTGSESGKDKVEQLKEKIKKILSNIEV